MNVICANGVLIEFPLCQVKIGKTKYWYRLSGQKDFFA